MSKYWKMRREASDFVNTSVTVPVCGSVVNYSFHSKILVGLPLLHNYKKMTCKRRVAKA